LPKSWREKYNTKNFIALETKAWLLIKPITITNNDEDDEDDWNVIKNNIINSPVYEVWDDWTAYYENDKWFGIYNENWIDVKKIISVIDEANAW
jgi:hypothetical protein